jgi:aspartate racemase
MNTITKSKFDNYLDLFTNVSNSNHDSIALKFQEKSLSYGELYQRVNKLANYLVRINAKPGMLIGVSAQRSLEMIISLLAVHRIGAAYVPLDPTYPPERINYMIDDAGLNLVITNHSNFSDFSDKKIEILNIAEVIEDIEKEESHSPLIDINPDDLAYVIYTSGSTGYPKGVMITHSNLMSFIKLVPMVLDMTEKDIYLQTASITYALSVRQIFVPLSYGLKLVIANPTAIQDPIELFRLIKNEKITLADFVPSHWRSCNITLSKMDKVDRDELLQNNLRRIVTVGEALLPDLPLDWKLKFKHNAQIVNIFGQTETTGIVTCYKFSDNNLDKLTAVPIGKPIPETKVEILDQESLSPAVNGEIGELCISSPCVGKGYLNNTELSKSKFVISSENGIYPLYRTGDFARISEDGNIEYLGRSDQQVKVRGMRVELGEIESVILRNPAIENVAVVPQTRANHGTFLAAFIATINNQNLNTVDLKNHIKSILPPHMVPVSYTVLDQLPRNPNGKIDRKKLMEYKIPDKEITPSEKSILSETEQKLVSIWKKLLGLNKINITDNFFDDLGGDSLLAVLVFLEIEKEFGKRMAISNLYRAPTIETLAHMVEKDSAEQEFHSLVPIRTGGSDHPLFIIHGAGGNVLIYRDLAKHLLNSMPIYGLQSYGLEGDVPLLNSIEEMAEAYIEEIKKVQPSGPYYICGYCMGGTVALEISQQLKSKGEKVAFLSLLETYDWSNLPKRSIYDKSKFLFQKFVYHWKNFYLLSNNGRASFIATKISDLKYRTKIWMGRFISKVSKSESSKGKSITKQSEIWKNNDNVAFKYKPRFFDGAITVFLPRKKYSVHRIDKAIWNKNHASEIDTVVLPVYPAGMLVEPFVKELAANINARIKQIDA